MAYGDFEAKLDRLGPVLSRIRFVHGRIDDSCATQRSVGRLGAEPDHVEHFRAMWTRCFAGFLADAKAGEVMIFAPELLPAQTIVEGVTRRLNTRCCCPTARRRPTAGRRRYASAPSPATASPPPKVRPRHLPARSNPASRSDPHDLGPRAAVPSPGALHAGRRPSARHRPGARHAPHGSTPRPVNDLPSLPTRGWTESTTWRRAVAGSAPAERSGSGGPEPRESSAAHDEDR